MPTEGEAIWQSILAERLRRNSLNPVVVYCSQALNTSIKVNNTEENFTDSSTSNSIPASSAAPSDKKLLCTVVSTLHTNKGDCYIENVTHMHTLSKYCLRNYVV